MLISIERCNMTQYMRFIRDYYFVLLAILAAMMIWLTGTNQALFFELNKLHILLPDSIWEGINYITYSKTYILPTLLIITTLLFQREKLLNILLLIICYYVLFNYMKEFFHEARPYIQYASTTFYWLHPGMTTEFQPYGSFPSGHTCNTAVFVFTLSCFFAQHKCWLQALLTGGLILVMLTRIATGWHFPLDVLLSAIIGYILTKIFISFPLPNIFDIRFNN